jgi:anhydro-N-acetylmuramic acid kinase
MASAGGRKLIIGVMSGTSLDGLDLAAAYFGHDEAAGTLSLEQVVAVSAVPFPQEVRALLEALLRPRQQHQPVADTLAMVCEANTLFARFTGEAILTWLRAIDIDPHSVEAIGFHGLTIWHRDPATPFAALPPTVPINKPNGTRTIGATLQIGDSEHLAAVTGIPVVSNFRAGDVAVGGSGAPLVPFFDRCVLASVALGRRAEASHVVLLNLGGISNFSLFDVTAGSRHPTLVEAADCGPANVLANEAIARCLEGRTGADDASASAAVDAARELGLLWGPERDVDDGPYDDRDGSWSAQGTIDNALLERWKAHPFLAGAGAARSTGREAFGAAFVAEELRTWLGEAADPAERVQRTTNFVATASDFVGFCVAQRLARALQKSDVALTNLTVLVTGGGAHNPALVASVHEHVVRAVRQAAGTQVAESVTVFKASAGASLPGLRQGELEDFKEALAFALLAAARLAGVPSNEPRATGAPSAVLLGQVSCPMPRQLAIPASVASRR